MIMTFTTDFLLHCLICSSWTPGDPSAVGSHTANGTSVVVRAEVSAETAGRRSDDDDDSTGGDDGNSRCVHLRYCVIPINNITLT